MQTHDIENDEPLEGSRRRSSLLLTDLVVFTWAADVRRGKYQQEQKDSKRRAVVHELHERRADEPTDAASWHQQVDGGHDGQETEQRDDDRDLGDEVVAAPAWDAGVPDGRQQLLRVWMCNEL